MAFIDHIIINGARGDIPITKVGNGAPTTSTVGAIGQFYMDKSTEGFILYKCVNVQNGVYTWKLLSESDLSDYVKNDQLENYVTNEQLENSVESALEKAIESGEIDVSGDYVPKTGHTANQMMATDANGDFTLMDIPSGGGSSGDSPIALIENTDSSNRVPLRSLSSGTYVLKGHFTAYEGSTASYTFSTGMLVAVVVTGGITYVQIFYPKNNTIQYLTITDNSVTRQDAKLTDMVSIASMVTQVNEASDDVHYPSAKAVYEAISDALSNVSGGITEETDPTVPAWAKASSKPTYSKSEVGLGNVDNVRQYSASNPPPYPVTSVNGKVGAVSLGASDVGALPSETTFSLGVHTDGLVYIFKDGVPVGTGVEVGVDGDVVGYVDSENNIVVKGNLADGAYAVKYEMEDGSTVDIGDLVLDSNVYYTITNNLTNCTTDNSATQVIAGQSYSATISAKSGYELKTVTATMGGNAVSVSGGNINIESVTGNIVITAVAEEKVVEPVTVDIGLTKDYSITVDTGALRESPTTGFCTTDFIDLTDIPKPCTINLTVAKWALQTATETGYIRFFAADKSGAKLVGDYTHSSKMPSGVTMVYNEGKLTNITVTVTSENVGKIRFCGCYTTGAEENNGIEDVKVTLTYTPES